MQTPTRPQSQPQQLSPLQQQTPIRGSGGSGDEEGCYRSPSRGKTGSAVDDYISSGTWRRTENANSTYSLQGLMQHIATTAVSEFWLNNVYSPEVRRYYRENRMHIHDLGYLSAYCAGWSIEDIVTEGFGGVAGKIQCRPPKHLNTALNQIVNFLFTLQGELAGAQALSNVDTFLAPFIRADHLTFPEVFKCVQSFVYSLNVPTRTGFQTPFTNISLDLVCPTRLADQPVFVGKHHPEWVYGDFQEEMDMFNRAFTETMIEGDGNGNIFSFPIPTYNLSKGMDWNHPRYESIWRMTAKYGIPYFACFINSDLNPDDFRSMCCRLRLDVRKLHTRNGGLFGSAPLTGSLGVVTVNLPNLAIRCAEAGRPTEDMFFSELRDTLRVAKDSLETKRKVIEENMGLYPYCARYLASMKARTGFYWSNHFNTIGVNGMNEACLVLFGKGIAVCRDFALRTLEFIKSELQKFQTETGNLYNLEATPAESTSFRLAQNDRRLFPDRTDIPGFYTNSTALPVDTTEDLFEALNHQEPLQCAYTGGTVFHAYLGEQLSHWTQARDLVKTMATRYRVPYLSLTPTFSICTTHGYISGEQDICAKCNAPTLIYSRIVGYYRPIKDWNAGKKAEFAMRKYYTHAGGVPLATSSEELPAVRVGGYHKLSMTDFPGKMSAVLFLSGCNLACGWCHNGDLAKGKSETLPLRGVLEHALHTEHKNLVITGGEPTVQDALLPLLRLLKARGVTVKLDTNGTKPSVLKQIFEEKLVDFIAMDLKTLPEKYASVVGVAVEAAAIRDSVELIRESGVPYQFRTTVVPGLHDVEDLAKCRELCGGALTLQRFRSGPSCADPAFQLLQEQPEDEFARVVATVGGSNEAVTGQ
eukprot:TRINITY_DN5664_c0_g1_i1.p1 TRINITY_DN5664_c0_g1~~TRINITY_DN5664_c0_g1_i1.p1  ORF type:complete len:869 (-),score=237.40 TRINITY_DN5664_c0_g1_i1:53-2659(-)